MNPVDPIQRYWPKVKVAGEDECWLWIAGRTTKGYGSFRWNNKNSNAQRFAWILKHGSIPDGLHVLHKCDNPSCQNPKHLFLGDNDRNIRDKMDKGRHRGARGERSATAKLTSGQVIEIRRLGQARSGYKSIGHKFGVSTKQIQAIIYGKTWKHLLPA